MYTGFWIETLVSRGSDHRPILVTCNRLNYENYHQRIMFWYEASWDLEEECIVNAGMEDL